MDSDLKRLVSDYERELIATALAAAGGNQRRAAVALGILPSTLCEKIKRLGMRRRPAPVEEEDRTPPTPEP